MGTSRLIRLRSHIDGRGRLTVAEAQRDVPFLIRRAFWIDAVPDGAERGGHAHAKCEQVIVCIAGAVTIIAGDCGYNLHEPDVAVYVPTHTQIQMRDWLPGSVLLVLCSEYYDATDYVYD